MQRLPAEEDSCRSDVVSHVDEKKRQIPASPQQSGQHYEPAHLPEQRRDRRGALSDEAGDDFRDEQEQEDELIGGICD